MNSEPARKPTCATCKHAVAVGQRPMYPDANGKPYLGIMGQAWRCEHSDPENRFYRHYQGRVQVGRRSGCWTDHEPGKPRREEDKSDA